MGLQCCELCVIAIGMVRAYDVAAMSRVIALSRGLDFIFQCCSDYRICPAKIVSSIERVVVTS